MKGLKSLLDKFENAMTAAAFAEEGNSIPQERLWEKKNGQGKIRPKGLI